MSAPITIFPARQIVTMNPQRPEAGAVAVREGRILDLGRDADELYRRWRERPGRIGDTNTGTGTGTGIHIDRRLTDKVLLPGLVEGHCHVLEGNLWNYAYLGYYDRYDPAGRLWPGVRSFDQAIERLRQNAANDDGEAILAWGFDPIFFGEERLHRSHLDRVARDRPVVVMHASGHLCNVNSRVIELGGIAAAPLDGIARDADGRPSGELREPAAMFLAFQVVGDNFFTDPGSPRGLRAFARLANRAGVTTATDLYNELRPDTVATFRQVTAERDVPLRLATSMLGSAYRPAQGVERLRELQQYATDKLFFGIVKLISDGSIQGFTARLRWPGYHNGAPNGLWVSAPQQLCDDLLAYHRAGFQVHIHCNGDEATDVALDALEQALTAAPRRDHRHTLQHCQMAAADQFRRMAALGACVNLFCNHLYYWGDAHHRLTLGPERAARMDAAASALRYRVPLAMHSDAPVTPLAPLFTAWCAVNRISAGGRLLDANERIAVADALAAITLGAAYTLRLDHLIGSIEIGKLADFAVLEQDPLAVAPEALKDIPVWGTVLGGEPFPSGRPHG